MDNTNGIIGFGKLSTGKKTILISIFAIWICTLIWLTYSLTKLDLASPSRKYVILIGMGFILITGFMNRLYKRFRTKK